jgi:hypothetical protein
MRTCLMLQVGLAIGLLASLGASGQTPSGESAEATETEYEVFSAYISQSFVGAVAEDRVGRPIAQIVVVNRTESDKEDLHDLAEDHDLPPGGVEKYLRKEVPSLRLATISNFHRANERQAQLGRHFCLPVPYQLVSAEKIGSIVKDAGSWPEYYKQYPGAQGYMWLSRIGFSPDGKQSLFYVSNSCGGLCATLSYVVMEKQGSAWKMLKEVVILVS